VRQAMELLTWIAVTIVMVWMATAGVIGLR
jgi:hypothetical protein